MDLEKMLQKCIQGQWTPEALDWSSPPRAMRRDEEIAIVQYFTNMAGIERLAAALFEEQGKKTRDPVLKQIFESFVKDEHRHAEVAQRLAAHYDRHGYQRYAQDPNLSRFAKAFVLAVRDFPPDVANTYITVGEIILDVALLRSLNDYVNDRLSDQAMALINRDESRHIAVDYHMIEYYCSAAYLEDRRALPSSPIADRLRAWFAFMRMLFFARPFFSAVFFKTMDRVDPSGKRIREAFKRIQLVTAKPSVRRRPFIRFVTTLQDLANHPVMGPLFSDLCVRVVGVDRALMRRLYDEAEETWAKAASFEALAQDVLQLKYN